MNEAYKNARRIRDAGFTMAAVAAAESTVSKADGELRARQTELKRTAAPGGDPSTLNGNGARVEGAAVALATDDRTAPLFSPEEAKKLRILWDAIQGGFVDEPRQAVAKADSLVVDVMKRLTEMFADEKSRLDAQWERGENVSTEELRVALRCYRSFFGRLLSI